LFREESKSGRAYVIGLTYAQTTTKQLSPSRAMPLDRSPLISRSHVAPVPPSHEWITTTILAIV